MPSACDRWWPRPETCSRSSTLANDRACSVDIDGQRLGEMPPGGTMEIRTEPDVTSLALLEGDSLYHHFRDRLL